MKQIVVFSWLILKEFMKGWYIKVNKKLIMYLEGIWKKWGVLIIVYKKYIFESCEEVITK